MKQTIALALVTLLTLGLAARADEKEAKDTLAKAIKAHGGEKALAKASRMQCTHTGTHVVNGKATPIVSKVLYDLPDRLRVEVDVNKGQVRTVAVVDGEKGFHNDGGTTKSLDAPRVKELREEMYVNTLRLLVPARKSDYTLGSLEKAKVNGESCVGVKVTAKGRPEVRLYFSEKTGLLAAAEWRGNHAGIGVDLEFDFSAYKEVDGVQVASKYVQKRNGVKMTEMSVSDVKFPAKFDEKTFAKP